MVGKKIGVWFWRTTSVAMIEAYRLRLSASERLSNLGKWPTAALAFTVPFLGGTAVSVLATLLRGS